MNMPTTLRIGTRKSPLAMRQAEICQQALRTVVPTGTQVTIHAFQTSGDAYLAGNLSTIGNKGLFTKEIERALLDGQIDIAVHSMKDVATQPPDGLIIPTVLKRDDVRDMLLTHHGTQIDDLPHGAVVGTSSLRRAVQLCRMRPDLKIIDYRGNIGRRMARLEEGAIDATLLAAAGLQRMEQQPDYAHMLETNIILPAAAQGAIGLQCRINDEAIVALLTHLNHPATYCAIEAERHLLARLDGSCRTPIAALATIHGETLTLEGMLAATDATWLHRHRTHGPLAERIAVADSLADILQKKAALHDA
ncbi:MAG: hydroxymethylbilane synthase [Sphaerospermopsis sp. SIO1G2]|nr:hydroxymethylbilane synthase [Sphaerospermopsis sp. SIO1G2]